MFIIPFSGRDEISHIKASLAPGECYADRIWAMRDEFRYHRPSSPGWPYGRETASNIVELKQGKKK